MKKSKLKGLLSAVICFVLVGSVVICGFAAEEKHDFSEDEIYTALISEGCPEEVLKRLTDGVLKKIGENIGEYSVGEVEYIPDYEIYNDGKNADYVKADVLKIELDNKNTGAFEGIALCVTWELEKKPFIKNEDYITFAWNSQAKGVPYKFVYSENSFYAEDLSDDGCAVNSYNTIANVGLDEIGHYTDISKSSGGIAVFGLNTASEEDVKELSELYFRIDYVHKTETLKTVFAIALPALVIIAIVVTVMILRRRKKKI